MQKLATPLPPVAVIVPSRIMDARGFISEVFNTELATLDPDLSFQDNHSYSHSRGTVRGLHYQAPPFAQAKLIRVIRGAIFDVVVDIRRGSPTFKQHFSIELSRDNWRQLFVPAGFAHGFCTLTDDVDVVYKVSKPYVKSHEFGLRWNDPQLGIAWPVDTTEAVLSEKDHNLPLVAQIREHFIYDG